MTSVEIYKIIKETISRSPLIHCITNPISISFCANAILAASCRPMMAEHPGEVCEITATADALLLNLGNITDVRMESMRISAECAEKNNIPCVLDLVGIACSGLRRAFASELLENHRFTVVKGNYSEIYALGNALYKSEGVDAEPSLEVRDIDKIAAELAKKYGCTILASGKTDVVTDGKALVHINNGSPRLARITGTGCVLGALTACFLPVKKDICSAVTACVLLGISGEMSESTVGNGSFAASVIDNISCITEKDIEKHIKTEEISIEEL